MTESVVASPAPVTSTTAAKKTSTKKKAVVKKAAAAHPSTSIMVTSAIKELKEKKGSSLPAIKKYLAANYKVDPVKVAPFIRKFLKAAVANGSIIQTAGTGASGHFKIAVAEPKSKPKKKTPASKKSIVKKPKAVLTPKKKKTAVKKNKTAVTEPAAKKLKKTPTKPKAAKAKKSPVKSKKQSVTITKSTKVIKVKKIISKKK
ncbi:Winged helix-turn-helix DNA-binding domain,Linker histone H1/H5, domain H15,Histone H5 [Cinara cedri]|uniref:Winged helix-turn-helix DNA-binding domain,Linker histone H1/H5, domain H15,Histone H5 n=1 Tax=Cinara cedri TaxID=506608 RepID=A0A5E4MPC7_9HEMI|nr:Winged helix-turn-helix DNA-binding domain,Linker histone H1/H5, domain H15,Histone H5 [Cinara cedri]